MWAEICKSLENFKHNLKLCIVKTLFLFKVQRQYASTATITELHRWKSEKSPRNKLISTIYFHQLSPSLSPSVKKIYFKICEECKKHGSFSFTNSCSKIFYCKSKWSPKKYVLLVNFYIFFYSCRLN